MLKHMSVGVVVIIIGDWVEEILFFLLASSKMAIKMIVIVNTS